MLVELPNGRGVGSVLAIEGDRCRVSLFHSIQHIEARDLPLGDLRRAFIGPQTRVYTMAAGGQWHVGRIKGYDPAAAPFLEYFVRFPNDRTAELPESQLRVRVFEPHADPAEVLAAGGGETQFLHDRRWTALTTSVRLRAAAQGLSGALSSEVELAPHQLSAVRRVLTDPVPRYLLADEVGMGKTIEAGVIARQYLIDDPSRRVEVLAPEPLVAQWRTELCQRCGLDDFGDAVTVRPSCELENVLVPDLLIIDEAHNLLGDPGLGRRLTELSHAAPRLLLLSATPALGDPNDLLALLHLLDPAQYAASDLPKLEARLALGRDLGRILLTLTDDAPAFLLKRSLQDLTARLPDDDAVAEVAAAFSRDEGDSEQLGDLRQHLADTYRVHQRLIRARRRDADLYFQPRGVDDDGRRQHLMEEVDEDQRWPEILAGLEDFRDRLLEETSNPSAAAQCFIDQLDGIGDGAGLVGGPPVPSSLASALSAEAGPRTRIEVAVDVVAGTLRRLKQQGQSTPKLVVFATHAGAVDALAGALTGCGHGIAVLMASTPSAEVEAGVRSFRDDPACEVLVCDRSGEEGLNLGFADAILHLDLPFSVTRIEQRIGRLDRFGRSKRLVRQRVLLPSDDDASYWAAWLEVLRDGFGIFESSTSDVQFILPQLEAELATAVLERGADGLRAMIPMVRDRLAAARRAADEQHALDAVALADGGASLAEAIEDAEADEPTLQSATEQWLVGALQLQREPMDGDQVCYRWTQDTLIPRSPWEAEFGADLHHPLTWRRRVAVRRGVPLLRPGSRLIDAMERHLRWDDRGSAFATWRVDPDVPGDDIAWLGFRLCFVIEPRLDHSLAIFQQADQEGLSRRAQRFLPAQTVELNLDVEGGLAPAPLAPILAKPYTDNVRPQGGRDFNLCSRPALFESVMPAASFAQLCREMRDRAHEAIRRDPDLVAQIQAAERGARADARRWARRGGDDGARAAELVVEAVVNPRLRLDSMGFFVLSRNPPATRRP